jgi:hypothetical protein
LPPGMGVMVTMMMGNAPNRIWAADTGCYAQPAAYSDARYLSWLAKHRDTPHRCLFATAPDVMGDAATTLGTSLPMLPRIRDAGYLAALVGQDGMTPGMVPWDAIDTLFIGGTTAWKLGEAAAVLIRAAKARGKWVHVGRVNSEKRVRHFLRMGRGMVDSVDGTYVAFGPDINGPKAAKWMRMAQMQQVLWGVTR